MTGDTKATETLEAVRAFPRGEYTRCEQVEAVGARCDAWWAAHRDQAVADAEEALRVYEAEGPIFDWLGGLGLRDDERFLTRVLAWLLSPAGTHGLGGSCLVAFFAECGLHRVLAPADGEGWSVEREPRFDWSGSEKIDSPDLVLRGPGVVLVVEHKVNAGRTSVDQYERYRKLANERWPDQDTYAVFLRSNPLRDDDPKLGGAFDAVLGLDHLCRVLEAAAAAAPRRAALLLASVLRGLRRNHAGADLPAQLVRDALRRSSPTPVLLARTQALIESLEVK